MLLFVFGRLPPKFVNIHRNPFDYYFLRNLQLLINETEIINELLGPVATVAEILATFKYSS